MPAPSWSAESSRGIVARIVVEGDLVLLTPAHFGNGDGDDLTDMPLLVDPLDGRSPLLTGASIAGALRGHLRAVQRGHLAPLPAREDEPAVAAERRGAAVLLFGGFRADDEGEQSPLIVEDARGSSPGIELRDGVRINPQSRTAEEDKLFDLQLWQAGTTFPLRFELLLRADEPARLKQALATALNGFADGSITLGARKRRGYGKVEVKAWRVRAFDLTTPAGLLDWLEDGGKVETDLSTALGVEQFLDDRREDFRLDAELSLDGSLLIRSGGGRDDLGPDTVHLRSPRPAGTTSRDVPILSGTSLAGALRARALRVARAVGSDAWAGRLVNDVFGLDMETSQEQPRASRLVAEERVVERATTDLVQNRVKIDRFTGGAFPTALFNEQPIFGKADTRVGVGLRLINPRDHEIGLLLLLLKDLWTGDLPLGGESSVGRGRLQGRSASLVRKAAGRTDSWKIVAAATGLTIEGDRAALEDCVAALHRDAQGHTS